MSSTQQHTEPPDAEQLDTEPAEPADAGDELDTDELDTEQLDAEPDDAGDELDTEPAEPDDADTFPRVYVEQLRRKGQNYRHRAQRAETRAEQLARELYRSRVAELGLLADPDDMEYDDELLMDADALRSAVSELVRSKPHLSARRVRGNIGQHEQPAGEPGASLGSILRRNA